MFDYRQREQTPEYERRYQEIFRKEVNLCDKLMSDNDTFTEHTGKNVMTVDSTTSEMS